MLRAFYNAQGKIRGAGGGGRGSQKGNGGNTLTQALLHFDGTAGTQVFTNQYSGTWQAGNASPVLGTTYKKFGTAGFAAAQYGIYSDNCAMLGGSGDFTVDFWLIAVAEPNVPWLFHAKPNGATSLGIGINYNAGVLTVYASSDGTNWLTGGALITTTTRVISALSPTPVHIALCRQGANLRLFVDGVQKGSTYNIGTTSIIQTTRFLLGNLWDPTTNTYGVNGNFDEFNLNTTTALYTANFTPPSSAYSPP